MSRSRFRRSYLEMGIDGAGQDILAHGITSGAYMKWDKDSDTLQLVNADIEIGGDVEVDGDLTLTTEDISVVQGRRVYLSGQDGDEYVSSEAAGYLDLEALTAIRPGADLLTDRWQSSITNVFIGMGVCGADGLAAAGLQNVAIGGDAMWSIATSKQNVAVGYKAMYNQTAGHYNVAVGYMALYEAEGSRNVAVGYQALKTMDAGTGANWNTGVGSSALEALTTGTCNVALGGRAGYLVTTGANNIVIGYTAGDNITTADSCIIIGHAVDAPSATVDAQIKIGGVTATQGYILGDSAGDMMVNAVTGKTVEIAVNATAVGTFAAALISLAQITSVTDSTEASAVGTASLKTAGGLGVAGKVYIGTELLLVAGPLDMSTVAEDIEIKANTVAALEIKGAATLLTFDTRNAITGVTAFAFAVPDIGFASASGSTRVGVSIDPGTLTFSGVATVTAMEGLGLYISAHTFAGTAATVTDASTLYIAAAPASGGSVTVTNGYALKIASGNFLTAGRIIVDDTTVSTDTITGSIQTDGGLGVAGRGNFGGIVIVTSTSATPTGVNAIYGNNVADEVYTTGNMVGVRGKTTLSGVDNYVSATGVWAGLDFATKTGTGSGLTCAVSAEVSSNNATRANAIIYLQSLVSGTANFSEMPYIVFAETRSGGTNTGSKILFEVGNKEGDNIPPQGAGLLFFENTLQIAVAKTAGVRTPLYIPLSAVEGTYTTPYLIQSTLSTASNSATSGAVIIAGGLGVAGRGNFGDKVIATCTAPTAAINAIAGLATPGATWASGEVNGVYGKVTVTLDSDGSTYSAAGGHFELEMVGNATSGLGLLAACMVKFTSNLEEPNSILYLESYPTGSCDLSETPFITFCDYKAGSGVKSNTLFRIGDPVMGQAISTGSGKLSYNQTLRCVLYSTPVYLVTSTDQGSYTTAYPIISTYSAGAAIDITNTLSAAGNGMLMTVSETGTHTSDVKGFKVAMTKMSGAITAAGAMAAISAEIQARANVSHAYAYNAYTGISTTPTIGDMSAFHCYCDNLGGTAANVNRYTCVDLNIDSTNEASGSTEGNSFIRMYAHGAAPTSAFCFPSSVGIDHLLYFTQNVTPLSAYVSGTTVSNRIAVKIATTTRYLHLFTS